MTTIREVAEHAGVSAATVSRALSGHEAVSPDTRARVQAVADRLGYRPSLVAAAMRTGRTGTIGLVIGDITNPFMTLLAFHVEQEVRRRGWVLAMANGMEDPTQQEAVTDMLLRQQVDGLLLVPAGPPTPRMRSLVGGATPVVFLDRRPAAEVPYSVFVDPASALLDVARHLAREGYERPAIIAGPRQASTGRGRAQAAVDALGRAGYDVDGVRVLEGDFSQHSGRRAMRDLLEAPRRPDAVIALSNLLTLGAMEVLQEQGLAIGEQVGLVSFDDDTWFHVTRPSISAVRQPVAELAAAGVEALASILEGRPPEAPNLVITGAEFIARGSTSRGRSARDGGPGHETGGPP
ncbi:LacI family DNA-binding transcriptional regulator [Georgenia thermotolerans]|uniref:LacI family DNA-binding transcriptional regulator n=1 Tax=Georgenia thermotolerans TaxID=527326 RepID=A0A7J5URH0_9MICO|nr:LacI family DNA-binding transcriptional regulator [Georgenia thermotolerans]KAE8764927.1 LacI family DNA-binding transcriptional regulator [Georgenia thermotolerans]